MLSRWQMIIRKLGRNMIVRVGLFCLIAVATALLGVVFDDIVPPGWSKRIGADAVNTLLQIIASSMLAVTTFSLNIMTSALGAATSNVTPRATRLLIEDTTSQTVLGTFIGSFLYAIVGIVALSAGFYHEGGRIVQFVVTLAVILVIVVTLLGWFGYLTKLGRVSDTSSRVETETAAALKARLEHPYLGGRPRIDDTLPSDALAVAPSKTGYLQFIDMDALSGWAKAAEGTVYVAELPGTFIDPYAPIAYVVSRSTEHPEFPVSAFVIGDNRNFDQDPRFGLCVLAEIASRALSPAVNDPGTALEVVGRCQRVLSLCAQIDPIDDEDGPIHPDVYVPKLKIHDLFDDAFAPVARDGAGMIEVQLRLQKAFAALTRTTHEDLGAASRRQSRHALERATEVLVLPHERERIALAAEKVLLASQIQPASGQA